MDTFTLADAIWLTVGALGFQAVLIALVDGVWKLGLWKNNRNIRRREEAQAHGNDS